jgi:hypothetical protein
MTYGATREGAWQHAGAAPLEPHRPAGLDERFAPAPRPPRRRQRRPAHRRTRANARAQRDGSCRLARLGTEFGSARARDPIKLGYLCHAGPMQEWEYKVFASHLDPAELVVLLDESGREGWELVTVIAVTDHLPVEVIDLTTQARNTDEVAEVVPMQAFRYIFKRPLSAL